MARPEEAAFTQRVAGHHYSAGIIGLFLRLVLFAATSQRGAAKALGLAAPVLPGRKQSPSANSGRCWLLRLGLDELTRAKEEATDWVWIMDHTLQLGSWKCLIIVGVRLTSWIQDPRPLEHEDVSLVGLTPMEHSSGEAVEEALRKATAKTGVPRVIVSDGGTDLKRGVELFHQDHPEVGHVYDITHKNALLLKKDLLADDRWASYVRESNQAKLAITQTPLAFLTPPGLKVKARYMNLERLVKWGQDVLKYLDDPQDVSAVRIDRRLLKKKLGWLRRYRGQLATWAELLALAEASENYVRHQGLHRQAAKQLRRRLDPLATCARGRRMKEAILAFVDEQASQAKPGERLIGSSEVIESIIGKYKRLQSMHSKGGMTAMLLSIGAIVSKKTTEAIRHSLERVSTSDVWQWCHTQLGATLQAQRKLAFQGNKNEIHNFP